MIPRMTTIGVLNNYRYDLNKSNNTMTKAMNTVMTGRSFSSYAEDPALATRCFQMRRSFQRTASQLDVNTSMLNKYNQAWSCLDTVSQDIYDSTVTQNSTAFGSLLRSENDADASGRNALGQALSALAKSIVQTMNGRNGENYVFGGADTLNPPFTWETRLNSAYVDPATADPTLNPEAFKYISQDGVTPTNSTDPAVARYEPVKNNANFTTEDDGSVTESYVTIPGEIESTKTDGLYLTEKSELKYCYEVIVDETGKKEYRAADGLTEEDYKYGFPEKVYYYTNTTDDPTTDPATGAQTRQAIKENDAYNEMTQYKYLRSDGTGTNSEPEAAQDLYFRGVPVDSNDYDKNMKYFLSETKYVDIGLGHKEQGGAALSSTVFNSALQGIYYLGGYGTGTVTITLGSGETKEVENVPDNLISIIGELGTILQRCNPDNGAYASDEDAERAQALARKLEDQQEVFIQRYAEIDTKSSFLRDNGELLTDTADSLAEQFLGLEDVDPADAITAYMYARYCYDAALKLGNSVLPQSLMDYMNL